MPNRGLVAPRCAPQESQHALLSHIDNELNPDCLPVYPTLSISKSILFYFFLEIFYLIFPFKSSKISLAPICFSRRAALVRVGRAPERGSEHEIETHYFHIE